MLISSHLISEMEMLCDKVVFLTGESVIKTTNITDMDYSEQIKLILYVDNASKALSLLRDPNCDTYSLEDEEDILNMRVNKNDINSVLLKIIQNDIKVYEVKKVNESLEELFVKYTGGNSIV
ncbi:MAG: hypothetical protein E6778_17740 [Niallia nealsonii]|nr:hypothetical protein [Niallia nealsonii]